MKKLLTYLSAVQYVMLAALLACFVASCSKEKNTTEDSGFTTAELAEMEEVDRYAVASSVIGALALIDELPDQWENMTFEAEVGVVLDEANTDVRNLVASDVDFARQYFESIVPDEGHNGDIWSYDGVGTLTFRAVNESDCHAVIDVNLIHMPGLKEIRFVPEELVGENSYSGEGFYHVGDVVKDKKGIYWLCVRPSGGPGNKSNAYFVSFDESLFKTATSTETIYALNDKDQPDNKTVIKSVSGKWTFAKSLVEERIAYAAGHTLALLYAAADFSNKGYEGAHTFVDKGEYYKMNKILNVSELLAEPATKRKGAPTFYIAYGSYKSFKNKKVHQAKYIQPVLGFTLKYDESRDCLVQDVVKAWPDLDSDSGRPSKNLISPTVDYDNLTFNNYIREKHDESWWGDDYELYGWDHQFSALDYVYNWDPYKEVSDHFQYASFESGFMTHTDKRTGGNRVLIMKHTSVKDHGEPYKEFTMVKRYSGEQPDYWRSLENTKRVVYSYGTEGKEIDVKE